MTGLPAGKSELLPARKWDRNYDARLLRQTAERNGGAVPSERWECAMQRYAHFCGEWNDYHGNYRLQKLPGGDHSALGDCQAVLALLQSMAEADASLPRRE